VVICTRYRAESLQNCLKAVANLRISPDELIVVDNTDGDGIARSAAQRYGARYIVEPRIGLSRARNRAISESNSKIIAFLDDDAVPDKHWLSLLVSPFVDPTVAIVTGSTPPLEGSECSPALDSLFSISNADSEWFVIAGFGGLGIGANMALRRAACIEPGTFDERLGRGTALGGGEESHAFVKLLSRGYHAVHLPAAMVTHPFKPSELMLEASRAFAYWLLLFFEFPGHRFELVRFLLMRLRHKPLTWYRSSPALGPIITSGWGLRMRACLAGVRLYLQTRKGAGQSVSPVPDLRTLDFAALHSESSKPYAASGSHVATEGLGLPYDGKAEHR
jgi:glycosyltransferase involved in cell wall biosynthesis